MAVSVHNEGRGVMCLDITGIGAAGLLGELENPEGVNVLILRGTLVVLEPSAGAANLTIGLGASASANTDVLAAEAMALGAGVPAPFNCFAMQNGADTAIAAPAIWTSGGATDFLTVNGSAATTGLVAKLFLEYIRID